MFKYISEILKSFTPAQRITALLILVFSIIILTLGPSLIQRNTKNCDELLIRIKSQEDQIVELNTRVTELNDELISGQKECTDNLIAKQKEIMDIVNGMIKEEELQKPKKLYLKKVTTPDFSNGGEIPEMRVEAMPPPPQRIENNNTLEKLKKLRVKIQKGMSNN